VSEIGFKLRLPLLDTLHLPRWSHARSHSMTDTGTDMAFEAHAAVTRTDHFFRRAASARDRTPGDDRLSLRSAALAIIGFSLLGWGILLIFVCRLFGGS